MGLCIDHRGEVYICCCCCFVGDIETCPGPTQKGLDEFMKSRGMKIFHQNVCGLLDKFHNLEELFYRHRNIDIMTLSETHIIDGDYNDNEPLFAMPGYTFLKRNRHTGKGGGLAMFIKDSIKWERHHDLENDDVEGIWVEVFIRNTRSFLIGVYYRPLGQTARIICRQILMVYSVRHFGKA